MTELVRHPALPKIPDSFKGDERKWAEDLLNFIKRQAQATYDQQYHDDLIVKDGPSVDVRAYGATGDGVTDDTVAIKAAIAACSSVGARVVNFHAGRFLISDTINTKSGVSLKGPSDVHYGASSNWKTVIYQKDGSNLQSLIYHGSGIYNVTIKGIVIDGNNANNTSGHGIENDGTDLHVENSMIQGCPDNGLHHSGTFSRYKNLVICNSTKANVYIDGTDAMFEQVEVQNADWDDSTTYPNIYLNGASNKFSNVRVGMDSTEGTDGLEVGTNGDKNLFVNCDFLNNARYGTNVIGQNNIFSNCLFSGAAVGDHATASHGLYVNSYGNTFAGCVYKCQTAGKYGLYIDSSAYNIYISGSFQISAGGRYYVHSSAYGINLNIADEIKLHKTRLSFNDRITFADGDTTPDVFQGNFFAFDNSGATDVTMFDSYKNGQLIVIQALNGNTTLKQSANLKLAGGIDYTMAADSVIGLIFHSSYWLEAFRRA